jgi:hypothetical protein
VNVWNTISHDSLKVCTKMQAPSLCNGILGSNKVLGILYIPYAVIHIFDNKTTQKNSKSEAT